MQNLFDAMKKKQLIVKKKLGRLLSVLLAAALLLTFASCNKNTAEDLSRRGYRKPLTEGVKNTLANALYMYNVFWTPLSDVSAWAEQKVSTRKFVAGHTYRGIPYGQPVHKGAYVGSVATVDDFVAAVNDPGSLLYTDRGENTWYHTEYGDPVKYSPFYSNDCSGFVSAAMGIKRHTTRDIGADPDTFPVKSRSIYDAEPGDLINSHEGGHVIMVLDVVYDREGGSVETVVTIEQTPDIIVVRSYGAGGTNGSLAKLQERMDSGKYYLCRYTGIDGVRLIDGVYEKMPAKVNAIVSPSSLTSVDGAVDGYLFVDFSKDSFDLSGYTLSWGEISYIVYEKDGGSPVRFSLSSYSELASYASGFPYLNYKNGYFSKSLKTSDVTLGSHIKITAKLTDGTSYTVADLTVKEMPSLIPYEACIDSYGYRFGSYSNSHFEEDSTLIMLNGWCVSDDIVRFEIKTDGGLWKPLGQYFRKDVYEYIGYEYPGCIECNAFNCGVDVSCLSAGKHTVTVRAVSSSGLAFDIFKVTATTPGNNRAVIILTVSIVSASAAAIAAGTVVFAVILKKRRKRKKTEADGNPSAGPAGCEEDRTARENNSPENNPG